MFLSLLALAALFDRHVGGRPLLRYEPRRRVPWGASLGILAIAMPITNVLLQLASSSQAGAQETAPDVSLRWSNIGLTIFFVVLIMLWIKSFYAARPSDLGLPRTYTQFLRDVSIGAFACAAVMVPVYSIQLVLVSMSDSDVGHPLVEQLRREPSLSMLLMGTVMAVVVAPLTEEFAFRVLFQGWLEKLEDQIIGFRLTQRGSISPSEPSPAMPDTEQETEPSSIPELLVEAEHIDENEISETGRVAREGIIRGLPHGWFPILTSGTLFGLAHYGHGVAPVSLVLLGIVLGYLYQRTHRLVPSMVTHMLFNGFSMLQLWIEVG